MAARRAASLKPIPPLDDIARAWNRKSRTDVSDGARVIHYENGNPIIIYLQPGMVTYVQLPRWETISHLIPAEKDRFFTVQQVYKNSFFVAATDSGFNVNVEVTGYSGLVYSFVCVAEPISSSRPSDLRVQIVAPWPAAAYGIPIRRALYGSSLAWAERLTDPAPGAQAPDSLSSRPPPAGAQAPGPTKVKVDLPALWNMPGDGDRGHGGDRLTPASLIFGDYRIEMKHPWDDVIRPVRVFHDQHFTYFDFGPQRGQIAPRPVVSLVENGVDMPVSHWTVGRHQSITVAAAIGNFTLQHGQDVVCVKYLGHALSSAAARAHDPGTRASLFHRITERQR